MNLRNLTLLFVPILLASTVPKQVTAQDRLVVFSLDAVNVDVKIAEAVSVAVATELESNGYTILDYETVALELESPTLSAPLDEEQPPLSDQQLKQAMARELGTTHYVDGSLVQLGRYMQIRLALRTTEGTVVATKTAKARSQNELPLAIERAVHGLVAKHKQVNEKPKEKKSPEVKPPRGPKLQKNFGVIFGQAFGFGDIDSFSQFAFDARLELENVIIEISPGVGFGPEAFENPQFIFDMAVSYYLTRTQVSPYLGAGLGVFAGRRFFERDVNAEVVVGWNLFPTIGVELLRNTFMRVHIDFRYLFNYAGNRFGHAPMVMAGVNF